MGRNGWVVMVTAAVLGCGGSGGPVPVDELEDDYERTLCEALVRCHLAADVDSCVESNDLGGELAGLVALVDAGTIDYDGDAARACIDTIAGAFADCVTLGDALADNPCDDVFVGTVPPGGACFEDEECAGEASCMPGSCDPQIECCAGTCVEEVVPPPVAIGEDCSAAECVDEGYCRNEAGAQTCVADAGENEPCQGFGTGSCVSGLYCNGLLGDGICVRPPGEGEICDPDAPAFACARIDNWCDPSDTTCKQRPGVGDPCNPTDDTCLPYAACGPDSTCVALPGLDEPCVADGLDCLGDLQCVGSVCTAPTPDPICTP